jgi:hypothetical protein
MATRSEYSVHVALGILAAELPLVTSPEPGDEEPVLKGEPIDGVTLGEGDAAPLISFTAQPLAHTANHPALLPTIDGRE